MLTNLPYFQALIMDLIRISDIHPIGVLHSPSQDTKIEGYSVPKGTFVIPNFHKVHHDPQYWEKPDELWPEHWLHHGEFVGKHERLANVREARREREMAMKPNAGVVHAALENQSHSSRAWWLLSRSRD